MSIFHCAHMGKLEVVWGTHLVLLVAATQEHEEKVEKQRTRDGGGKFATLCINSDPVYLNRKTITESRKAATSPERVPELYFEWFCPSGGINRQRAPREVSQEEFVEDWAVSCSWPVSSEDEGHDPGLWNCISSGCYIPHRAQLMKKEG